MLELVDDGHHVEASLMLKTNPAPQIAPNFLKLLLGKRETRVLYQGGGNELFSKR
jgi:hypothetical protein